MFIQYRYIFWILFLCCINPAHAEVFYGGASLGISDANDACNLKFFEGSCDNRDTAWKIFGGLYFMPGFAVEGSYLKLGEYSSEGELISNVFVSDKTKFEGFNVSAVGYLPVHQQIALFGKAGLIFWEMESNTTENNIKTQFKDDGASLSLGGGAAYSFTENLGFRAEWEHFHNLANDTPSETNLDLFSVGVTFSTL